MHNYHHISPLFTTWELKNKTVLVRVDYNMTYFNGTLLSDYKIRRTQSTLDSLLQQGASIKLVTHQEPVNGHPMSTEPLISWFKERKYSISFTHDLATSVKPQSITLCENIRFFEGEKSDNRAVRAELALQLRKNTDYYVFDGFGVAHRTDTSVADVPLLFNQNARSIGFLVADEIKQLYPAISAPKHPYIAVCAGNKRDKLTYLNSIKAIDAILLAPLLCFEKNVTVNKKIEIPKDFKDTSFIGEKTTQEWSKKLTSARTILCNGLMGILEKPESLVPFNQLLDTIAKSTAHSIIAGGSTTSYVDSQNRINDFSFCSTGGGSTLAYLAQEKLPGLDPFLSAYLL